MLLNVVIIDLFWANHPWDNTLSFISGHVRIGEFPMMVCIEAFTFPLLPWIVVFVGVSGIELVLSSQDSLLKTMQLAPESKIHRSMRCWMALTFTTLAAPSSGRGSSEYQVEWVAIVDAWESGVPWGEWLAVQLSHWCSNASCDAVDLSEEPVFEEILGSFVQS